MRFTKLIKKRLPVVAALILLLLLLLPGKIYGSGQNESPGLKVVATTTMLYDLSCIISGNCAQVTGLMGPGIDPHQYKASAGDVLKLDRADVVVYSGLDLEGRLGEIFSSMEHQGRQVVCAAEGIDESRLLSIGNGRFDPHIWFDISLWKAAARHLTAAFSRADPKNSDIYAGNLETYMKQLDELDIYVADILAQLPKKQRVLVTAHDGFGYFGRAYNFELLSLQGINTQTEAGTADLAALADFISDREIKALFVESSVPKKSIEALQAAVAARGFYVDIGSELYSDSLGDGDTASYIQTFKYNVAAMVSALG